MSNIIPIDNSKLPAFLRKNAAAVANDLTANVGTGGYPVFSFKGKEWALKRNGEYKSLMNPNAPDEPATSIQVVILKASPNLSKVWYLKGYTEGSDAKPDCFSNDGIAPDPSVEKPQAKKCSVCPKNEWGSRVTDDGKKAKACSDSRRLAVAAPDKLDDPILLRVPPASLKPLAEYGSALAKAGAPYNAVITKIGFERVAAPQLTFKFIEFLEEDQYAQVQKVIAEDVVSSILGKPGEAPVPEAAEAEDAPAATAPAPEPEPAKSAPKKTAKAAVTEAEVEAAVEPKAEKPAPKKAEPKVTESDSLEDELDALLGDLDD